VNENSSRSGNDHALHKQSPRVASKRCVLVGAASTVATAEAICFELVRCREEAATRLQDPMPVIEHVEEEAQSRHPN